MPVRASKFTAVSTLFNIYIYIFFSSIYNVYIYIYIYTYICNTPTSFPYKIISVGVLQSHFAGLMSGDSRGGWADG